MQLKAYYIALNCIFFCFVITKKQLDTGQFGIKLLKKIYFILFSYGDLRGLHVYLQYYDVMKLNDLHYL